MNIKLCLIFFNFLIMHKVTAIISVVDVGVLPLVEHSIGITFYVDITNEDRLNISKIYSRCQKCCLIDSHNKDCNVTIAYGEYNEDVNPRDRKTLLFVAPMLLQHDLDGFCEFLINFDYNNTKGEIDVTVPFNTKVGVKRSREILKRYVGRRKISRCTTLDQDSLNNCEQVDCKMKYLDKRPVFDQYISKCIEVAICFANPDKELPDNVYEPNSNTCRNLDLPLTVQDIYAISTGLGTVTMNPDSNVGINVKVKSNCSTISENLNLLRDLMYGKMYPMDSGLILDYSECFKLALYIITKCIITACAVLFLFICCVNSIIWLYIKWSHGKLKDYWTNFTQTFKRSKCRKVKREKIDNTIRDALLREVLVRDIPLELRNSVIDVCDRMEKKTGKRKRHRKADVWSQVSLEKSKESLSSSMSSKSSFDDDKG